MELYQSALQLVNSVPERRPAGLVVRHSARFPITGDADVYTAALTEEGIRQAEQFGAALAQVRQPGRLLSSPVGRCIDTGHAIARGAEWEIPVQTDLRLSHPFIEGLWQGNAQVWKRDPVPGAVHSILEMILTPAPQAGQLDLFITHDTVLAVLAGFFTGARFAYPDYWPDFLEGVLVWREHTQVHLHWRDMETIIEPWPFSKTGQLAFDFATGEAGYNTLGSKIEC